MRKKEGKKRVLPDGLTQVELAALAGVHRHTIRRWLIGESITLVVQQAIDRAIKEVEESRIPAPAAA